MIQVKMDVQSDSELVQKALNGDRQAYGRLFERHERSVLAVALAVLGDYHAAQDAAQETCVTAYTRLRSLRRGSSFGAWVRKIARREAIAARRRMSKAKNAGSVPAERDRSAEDGCIDEQTRLLLAAVLRLPKHEQEVLTLRYFEGHSVKTISEMTGRPVGTVTMQLSRARTRLRKWLKESLT
jgi:RNA polymerase sigma-70 factor (ECF subfamily)